MPWIRIGDKKGVYRILVFKYEGGLWETDDGCDGDVDSVVKEYLEPNGLGEPVGSFWSTDKTIWFPQIDAATDLRDFFFEKDKPAADALRWETLYWTKEDLGVNQFHRRQLLAGTTSAWDFLSAALGQKKMSFL